MKGIFRKFQNLFHKVCQIQEQPTSDAGNKTIKLKQKLQSSSRRLTKH